MHILSDNLSRNTCIWSIPDNSKGVREKKFELSEVRVVESSGKITENKEKRFFKVVTGKTVGFGEGMQCKYHAHFTSKAVY